MIGDLAGNDLVLLAVAAHAVVVAGQLQRRLDSLRAAGGEEDAVEVAGERGDPRRQLDRARVGIAPQRVEVELFDLAGGGLAELGAPMAGVDAEEGGEPVEMAVAVVIVDVAALAATMIGISRPGRRSPSARSASRGVVWPAPEGWC